MAFAGNSVGYIAVDSWQTDHRPRLRPGPPLAEHSISISDLKDCFYF